ncbi:hypothetical protein ASE39_24610 [Acidovorax sp. Root267]|nr:hypothetical protein ASE39_24610 [Acidovorax sp. Root267]
MQQRFGAAMEASISILDSASFQGTIRSGRVGSLRYCHIKAAGCSYSHRIHQPEVHGHSIILQLSGVTEIHCGAEQRLLRPGEFLLINDLRHLRIDNPGPVEHILLLNPLSRHPATCAQQSALSVRHANQSATAHMAYRWIPDACSGMDWSLLGMGGSLAGCVSGLLDAVFSQTAQPRNDGKPGKLHYEDVLMYIAQALTEAELGVASIARALGCSTRTLHRISHNAGGESIERCIRRLRIEKCGELLRTAQVRSITELSALYGFASPAHFSNAFRSVYGVSPSQYRLSRAFCPIPRPLLS